MAFIRLCSVFIFIGASVFGCATSAPVAERAPDSARKLAALADAQSEESKEALVKLNKKIKYLNENAVMCACREDSTEEFFSAIGSVKSNVGQNGLYTATCKITSTKVVYYCYDYEVIDPSRK